MPDSFLQYCRATLSGDEAEEVVKVIESGWLTTGPNVAGFEKEFKEYIGCEHTLALNSCTGGLHCALSALGVGAGDEVITSPFTFVASGHVIVWTGAKPVLVDVDPNTFNIDPEKVEKAITPKTKAILPIHFAGLSCDMDALLDIGKRHNIPVIEDAAHAAGSEYKGKKVGSFGDVAVFSFYPTKNMTTGEGGMVTTNDPELADRIRKFAFFGIDKEVWERYGKKQGWQYDIILPGFKYNMSDVLATIGRVQLKQLDRFNLKRSEIADFYKKSLSGLEDCISLPPETADTVHNWHLFPIRLDKTEKTREGLIEYLTEKQIGSSVHFIPLHLFSYYQKAWGYKPGDFPVVEKIFKNIVSIPLYPGLTDGDQERIVSAIYGFFDRKPPL